MRGAAWKTIGVWVASGFKGSAAVVDAAGERGGRDLTRTTK